MSPIVKELVKIPLRSGMAIELIPLCEKGIIEKMAVEILTKMNCTIIGKEGILGVVDSIVGIVEGLDKEVKKILEVVKEINRVGISVQKENLEECERGDPCCSKGHLVCVYLRGD